MLTKSRASFRCITCEETRTVYDGQGSTYVSVELVCRELVCRELVCREFVSQSVEIRGEKEVDMIMDRRVVSESSEGNYLLRLYDRRGVEVNVIV